MVYMGQDGVVPSHACDKCGDETISESVNDQLQNILSNHLGIS